MLEGGTTFKISLEEHFSSATEKARITTLQTVINIWFDEKAQKDYAVDVNDYNKKISIKHKSKSDILLLTVARWEIKIHQDLVVRTNRIYLKD